MNTRLIPPRFAKYVPFIVLAAFVVTSARSAPAETINIGIGTQNTTTNTVTGGVVLKELGILEKHLPHTGKYANATYNITWQNATSGPPITNGMMADNIQIGMMGDYPLLVNGATGQATGNETQLIAIIAYNEFGGGNGIVVNKDSPYYDLADLKGKTVSVPFGSAAHGMMLAALQKRALPTDFWNLVSQSPEVGSTNLQEKRIDAHGDFVPFAELLPFRGFARKIFDGAETKTPTFHGVVVRKDFAEKYPEIVVAYIEALIEANNWMRGNPQEASEKIEKWTGINKEVVYVFLGPNGVHTLDPTLKLFLIDSAETSYGVLKSLKMIKNLDIKKWVNDTYVRAAFKDLGLNYDSQLASRTGYSVAGHDPVCDADIAAKDSPNVGQIWIDGGDVVPFSSPICTFKGVKQYTSQGKKLDAVYLVDHALGIKMFADKAFYSISADKKQIVPFLLKKDAETFASANGGRLGTYDEAVDAATAQ